MTAIEPAPFRLTELTDCGGCAAKLGADLLADALARLGAEAAAWPDASLIAGLDPPDDAAWDQSIERFQQDLKAMEKLISDPHIDLTARIPHGNGQTLLREALLVADHNAYHIGQLMVVRKLLEARVE